MLFRTYYIVKRLLCFRRVTGFGFITIAARLAMVLAPVTTYIHSYYGNVSTLLPFGVLTIVGGVLSLLLPETSRMQMVERPEQMEEFSKWAKHQEAVLDLSEVADAVIVSSQALCKTSNANDATQTCLLLDNDEDEIFEEDLGQSF